MSAVMGVWSVVKLRFVPPMLWSVISPMRSLFWLYVAGVVANAIWENLNCAISSAALAMNRGPRKIGST